ncbi:MAG TPA: M1 family aminopeptidase [Candidatus Deferrimicrobiaceae bacterium]|jgi:hypothetical protein
MGTRATTSGFRPRRFLPLVALLALACGCAAVREHRVPALPETGIARHRLSVTIEPALGRLSASDTIELPPGPRSAVSIALAPGIRILGVTVAGTAVPHTFTDGVLRLSSPAPMPTSPVRIDYEAEFRDPVPDRPVNTEDPGYGISGTITGDGTFLSPEAGWHPAVVSVPNGYRIRIDAPEGYEALTDGRRMAREAAGGRSTSEWEIAPTGSRLALAASRYIVREKGAQDGTPVYTYFSPENDPRSERYLSAAAGFLALYRDLLGPYPFPKFAIADNFFPSGYGFPSWTLLGRDVVRLPFILDTSLGHEIAHSWWGNGVRVKEGSGNWSEGLTSYVADYLYDERASPEKGREHRLKLLRDYATLVPPDKDFPLARFSSRTDAPSRAVGYGKGAMVFHMARVRAGERAFWAALRRVVREKMFREASWADFATALEKESGKSFGPFFAQWVDRPGAPVLSLEGTTVRREGSGWNLSGRVVQAGPAFALDVPMRIDLADGTAADFTIALQGASSAFSVRVAAPPRSLLLDPDVTLFRRLSPEEIPPAVNHIHGSTSLLAILAEGGSPELRAAGSVLLASMGQEKAPILDEAQATPDRLAGHDLLLLGLPSRAGLLPRLPPALSVSTNGFTLDGTRHTGPGETLFAALPHPSDRDRRCALFLPLPGAIPATEAARKIVHYGKYGYLVFSGGTNRVKGFWPPGPSSAVVEFAAVAP